MKKFLKKTYDIMPFKPFFYKGLKRFYTLDQNTYKHLHFKGVYTVNVTPEKKFKINHFGFQVENDIFWSGLFGNWEKDSLLIWSKLCEKSDVIFDIGANTGIYTLIAKSVNNESSVFAFDPIKRVYDKLSKNIQLNNFDVKSYQIALSDKTGEAIVYDIDAEHTYSVTVNKNLHSDSTSVNEVKINTLRLDEFIEQNKIDKIDIMKIDVETHEPEVLEGMGKYLNLFKPILLIEILNDNIANQIQKLIADIDYVYFNLNEKGDIKHVNKLSKSEYHNFLICDKKTALQLTLLP
jgi:FkbM family methyltransferase